MAHRLVLPLTTGALALSPAARSYDEFVFSGGLHAELTFGADGVSFGAGLDLRGAYTEPIASEAICQPEARYGGGVFGMVTFQLDGGIRLSLGAHGGSEVGDDSPYTGLDFELGWVWRTAYDGHPSGSGLHVGLLTSVQQFAALGVRSYISFLDETVVTGGVAAGAHFFSPFKMGLEACAVGRPWRVDGRVMKPRVVARGGNRWDPMQRAIASAWLDDARGEAASVPAFQVLARDLERLGAPTGLVREARRSAMDEIRHTGMCRRLAERHSGARFVIERLRPTSHAASSLTELALDAWRDGCLAEGASALRARLASERATDPESRATQRAIAVDEARHAGLAWDTIRFALERDRSVRDALAAASVETFANPPEPALDDSDWRRFGRLDSVAHTDAWLTNRERATRRLRALLEMEHAR